MKPALLIASLILALGFTGFNWQLDRHEKCVVGMISTSIGMSITHIERASGVPIKFVPSSDIAGYAEYHENIPHDLEVISGELRFVLPNMYSVAMQVVDGKLQHIDDRPSAGLMVLEDALRSSNSITQVMDQSGWKRDKGPTMELYSGDLLTSYQSISQMRDAFLNLSLTDKLRGVRIGTWRHGKEKVNLELDRIPYFREPKHEIVNDQVYFVTVVISRDQNVKNSGVKQATIALPPRP
jgi:hypothetical protein